MRLKAEGLEVWYDEGSLGLGESVRRSIEKGLAKSNFAVVICSPDYFRKGWTQRELDSLVELQNAGRLVIFPVWHKLADREIGTLAPSLAGTKAIDSGVGVDAVAAAIVAAVRNRPPPSVPMPRPVTEPSNVLLYAGLSLVCFLLGAALFAVMIWRPETLATFGLTDKLFYVVLIPIGLATAGFLFGVLRSYARYSGNTLGGTLELGGPIVAAGLVVIGGFQLPPGPGTFPFTVYVHGEAGAQDLVLKDKGQVTIQLGLDSQSKAIRETGQAYFPAISSQFRGREVNLFVQADGFEAATTGKLRLNGESVSLLVRKSAVEFSGDIQDQDGNPIGGALVEVAGRSARTGPAGHFLIGVPGNLLRDELPLTVTASGYQAATIAAVVGSNPVRLALARSSKK